MPLFWYLLSPYQLFTVATWSTGKRRENQGSRQLKITGR